MTGQTPARDVALLHVLYGTGITATELAQLEVADVLDERGDFRRKSEVRAAISFNGRARPVFWVNPKVCDANQHLLRRPADSRAGRDGLALAVARPGAARACVPDQ